MDIMAVRPTEARARSQTPKLGPYSVPWEPTDVDHQECGVSPIRRLIISSSVPLPVADVPRSRAEG